ncbi:MAG: hypothetical protein LBU09_05395, partial [Endomicrobium sp.]|nr:hypothetical protein [Endomicrobium sp.]
MSQQKAAALPNIDEMERQAALQKDMPFMDLSVSADEQMRDSLPQTAQNVKHMFEEPKKKSVYLAKYNTGIYTSLTSPEEIEYAADIELAKKARDNYFSLTYMGEGESRPKVTRSAIEQLTKGILSANVSVLQTAQRQIIGAIDYVKNPPSLYFDIDPQLREKMEDNVKKAQDFQRAKLALITSKHQQQLLDAGLSKDEADGILFDVGAGVQSLFGAVGLSIITKSPSSASIFFGWLAGRQSYEELVLDGMPPSRAAAVGSLNGAAQAAQEYIGLHYLSKAAKIKGVAARVLGIAEEPVQEGTQGLTEELVMQGLGTREKSLNETVSNIFYQSLIGAIVGAPASVLFHQGYGRLKEQGVKDEAAKNIAAKIVEAASSKEAIKEVEKIVNNEDNPLTFKNNDEVKTLKEAVDIARQKIKSMTPERRKYINDMRTRVKDEALKEGLDKNTSELMARFAEARAVLANKLTGMAPQEYYQKHKLEIVNYAKSAAAMEPQQVVNNIRREQAKYYQQQLELGLETANKEYSNEEIEDVALEYLWHYMDASNAALQTAIATGADAQRVYDIVKNIDDGDLTQWALDNGKKYDSDEFKSFDAKTQRRIKRFNEIYANDSVLEDLDDDIEREQKQINGLAAELLNAQVKNKTTKELKAQLKSAENRLLQLRAQREKLAYSKPKFNVYESASWNANPRIDANTFYQAAQTFGITEDEAKRQYEEVVKKYKGTDKWLKSPNGQSSNLDERQWVMVRTPAFKKWFGDWEKAEILKGDPLKKVSAKDINIIGKGVIDTAVKWFEANPIENARANTIDGDFDVVFTKDGIKDSFGHTRYPNKVYVLPALKDIIEKGAYLGKMADLDGKRIDNYYFGVPVEIDGKRKIVFVRVRKAAGDTERFYIHEIFTDDEIEEAETLQPRGVQTSAKRASALYKSIIKNALDVNNVSKVVDENGEPQVALHYSYYGRKTKKDFNIFDITKGLQSEGYNAKIGFWFLNPNAKDNGMTDVPRKFFLDIKDPAYTTLEDLNLMFEEAAKEKIVNSVDEEELREQWDNFDENEKSKYWAFNYYFSDKKQEALEQYSDFEDLKNYIIENQFEFAEQIRNSNFYGNDGLIVDDSEFDGISYVAFQPNQIKSVDNQGTFDGDNSNVYYQGAYHGGARNIKEFSNDFIGSGEGVQAFGWGHYFTSLKEIAKRYKNSYNPVQTYFAYDGQSILDMIKNFTNSGQYGKADVLTAIVSDKNIKELKEDVAKYPDEYSDEYKEYLNSIDADKIKEYQDEKLTKEAKTGQLYKVELPESKDFLQWDKPMSQQNENIQWAVENICGDIINEETNWKKSNELDRKLDPDKVKDMTGEEIYRIFEELLGSDKAASQQLLRYGVKGNEYPAGTLSAMEGQGRNFVLFDPKRAHITETYYQMGAYGYNDEQKKEIYELLKPYENEYTQDITGDAAQGDEVVFVEAQFSGSFRNAKFTGFKVVKGHIIIDSDGNDNQQLT